jgi:hypothetical protein
MLIDGILSVILDQCVRAAQASNGATRRPQLNDISYPYKPPSGMMAIGIVLFLALGLYIGQRALTNDRELVLNGIIHIGQDGASVFFASLAALMALGLLIMLKGLYKAIFSTQRVTLSASAITSPPSGISSRIKTVKLINVRQVNMKTIQKQRRLCITHTNGELNIHESCLPGPSAFDALCRAFAERMAVVNKPLA